MFKRLYFMSMVDTTRNTDVLCCKKDEDLTMALPRDCSTRKQPRASVFRMLLPAFGDEELSHAKSLHGSVSAGG